MAYSSELDKLLARHKENPKGRNFAPLADAYRKAGQVDEAIKLCRQGIELHPDYVSAHIVLGRCFMDKKDDAAAEAQFGRVLGFDPENVIALKVLSDIAIRTDRPAAAVEWLGRLLNADPMNGDAAEALALAKGKVAAAATKAAAEAPVAPAPRESGPMVIPEPDASLELRADTDPSLVESAPALPGQPSAGGAPAPPIELERFANAEAPTARMSKPDFEVERASSPAMARPEPLPPPPPVPPPAPPPPPPPKAEAPPVVAAAPPGLVVEETDDVIAPADVAPLDGLARTQYEGSGMFKVDASELSGAEEPLPKIELPLIMPEQAEAEAQARRSSASRPAPRFDDAPARASRPLPMLPDDDGAADRAALSEAEPVLTETMAELYRRQGHLEDARRVYRALLERHPGDARLTAKLAEVEGRPAARTGQPVPAFLRAVFRGEAVAPPLPPEAAEAPASGGSMMDDAFNAPDAAPTGSPEAAAPTQPAKDSFSLDAVFGESRESEVLGVPEPEPAQASPRPSGFSFDEFFGGEGAPPGGDGPPPSRLSGRMARGQEAPEDLDQFQTWLRGLKS